MNATGWMFDQAVQWLIGSVVAVITTVIGWV